MNWLLLFTTIFMNDTWGEKSMKISSKTQNLHIRNNWSLHQPDSQNFNVVKIFMWYFKVYSEVCSSKKTADLSSGEIFKVSKLSPVQEIVVNGSMTKKEELDTLIAVKKLYCFLSTEIYVSSTASIFM